MSEQNKEYVDFAVQVRKYKTLLTKKYLQRKPWQPENPNEIRSYIPGTVVDIFVQEGQTVKAGEALLILEAMKMRNRIEMPFDGKIKRICVEKNVRIPKNTLMIELEKA